MLMTDGLMRGLPGQTESQCLGELWLAMTENLATGSINPFVYRALDAVDGDPKTPQATQRLEHLEMFLLLGDPAVRLPPAPQAIDVTVEGGVSPGSELTIRGRVPSDLVGAVARVTIERTVRSRAVDIEPLPPEDHVQERGTAMEANHDRSNRFVLNRASLTVDQREFETRLELPTRLSWSEVIVRIYAATPAIEGMAVLTLQVVKEE